MAEAICERYGEVKRVLSVRNVNDSLSVEKKKALSRRGVMYGALGALRLLGWSFATPILRCSQGLQSAIGILLLCLVWTTDIVSNYPSYMEM